MAYRKLGRTNKHRRSMLANLTRDVIMHEKIQTTDTRAKETRRMAPSGRLLSVCKGKKGFVI